MPEHEGPGPPLRVLLLGASGTFGSHLAEGLAQERGLRLTLAGRRKHALEALALRLSRGGKPWCEGAAGSPLAIAVTDRQRITADDLTETDLVIDAAGPFQREEIRVLEAAVGAQCHYLDLADGRDFVAAVPRFSEAARAAGIAVLSGASTTPALSHAVLDQITAGWRRVDSLRVAVCPGNRAPRGLSVVRSILSYAGRPVRLFREGAWSEAPGWGLTRWIEIPGLGPRLASLCETPDLDLLVARYRPRVSAEFLAGLELPLLHRGLGFASLAVRAGLIRSLVPSARVLRHVADWLRPFGSDRGGMLVEASGQDEAGRPVLSRWSLVAEGGVGPKVPTLAALALVRRIRDGGLAFRGAAACTDQLELADFAADFARLGISTQEVSRGLGPSLFHRALGRSFDLLPRENRILHSPDPTLVAEGSALVSGAETRLGRFFAGLFGFPESASRVPLRVVIEATAEGGERWTRIYPTRVMRSIMTAPDASSRTLEEHFGRLAIELKIEAGPDGLSLTPLSGRWWRVPVPRALLPRVRAREFAEPGRHGFDVTIGLPLLGRLVTYRGFLEL